MREPRKFSGSEGLLKTIVAGAVLLCGCADLALETERIPTELVISPARGLFNEGEPTRLEVVVKDQNGKVMPVPGWVRPAWEVRDGSAAELSPDGSLTGRKGGSVRVMARLAALETDALFHIQPDEVLLGAPVIYLTQAAQNRSNTVRLISGRPALLRIFVVGDEPSFFEPAVKVTLLQEDDVVFESPLLLDTMELPTRVDESSLVWSFNTEVPGMIVQPGLRMVVEVDPEGVIPLTPGSQTRYPAEGSMALEVVELPVFRMILVPIISRPAPDSSVLEWTDGANPDSEQLRMSRTLLPVGTMEVEVHETYNTSLDLRDSRQWIALRNEIGLLYEDEGRRGYYYGAVGSGSGGFRGTSTIGYPVSVGTDADHIHTHEIGHAMGLYHAPCGGAFGPDPNYPYREGSIGVWGYDFAESRLLDPGLYKDAMGLCGPSGISDYHFDRAMRHRLHGDGGINHDADPAAYRGLGRGEVIVVWGAVWEGRSMLEPAFVLDGPVVLPEADGPYRVEGLGAGGETRFSLSFSPTPLEHGGGSFVFFVPYEPEWADNLDRMVLTGPGGEYTIARDGEPPMAVMTDRSTGRIQAIIRNWDGGPLPGEETADVTITRGIPARGLR